MSFKADYVRPKQVFRENIPMHIAYSEEHKGSVIRHLNGGALGNRPKSTRGFQGDKESIDRSINTSGFFVIDEPNKQRTILRSKNQLYVDSLKRKKKVTISRNINGPHD